MSRGVNRVILVGNVGRDPEIRDGDRDRSAMASFSLATTEKYKEKETTEWHRCTVWGALADVVDQYVRKGDKLAIVGRIRYRQYKDKDGNTRYSTNINVDELVMLGSPSGARRDDEDDRGNAERRPRGAEPEPGEYDEPEELEEKNARRGGATEDDIPAKDRPSGLKARSAGKPAQSAGSGSAKRGPVKSRKPRAR